MRTKTIGLAAAIAWAGQGCVVEAGAHGTLNTTVSTEATVFGSSSAYAGSVEGTLYYLDPGTQRLPTNWDSLQARGRLYTDRWDVGPRPFDQGFPGVSRRTDWFAIRYVGRFEVATPGLHSFRLHASAGARLLIDGQAVVDNDGMHGAQSATGQAALTVGVHSIELQYFQGPSANIALQLFTTPPGGREQLFVVQAPRGQVTPPPPVVVTPPPPPPPPPVVVTPPPPPPPPPPVVVTPPPPPPPPARPARPDRRPPVAPPRPATPVMTPFGSTATFSGAFQGNVYHLPSGTARLPTNWSGMRPVGSVYADRWDIPQRPFGEGLPGVTDRTEWFAIRYTGRVQITAQGAYTFRVASHDGARLLIDGRVVVDNDGRHSFQSANGTVTLSPGTHDFELQYFQGARDVVGLQVFVTPPYSSEQIFVAQPGGIVVAPPPPQPPPPPHVVVPPPPPGPPVVVPPATMPFGSATAFTGALQGNIYYLPDNTQRLPTDWASLQPRGSIFADRWDIAQRSFSEGFPGVSDRFEWFAIRYTGQIAVAQAGDYSFRIESDDGAKLIIDGRVVVDNDGVHPVQSRSGAVSLTAGVHTIELQYFQGPRYDIALRVFVTAPGGTERIFVTRPGEAGSIVEHGDDAGEGRGRWEGRGPRTDDREGGRGPREGRGRR